MESAVKAAKSMMTKCVTDVSDQYLALRNTPLQGLPSPAQLIFQRRTRSLIPITPAQLKPTVIDAELLVDQRIKSMNKSHDRSSKPVKPFVPGDVKFDIFDSLNRKHVWDNGVIETLDKTLAHTL